VTRVLRYLIPAGTGIDVLSLGLICFVALIGALLTHADVGRLQDQPVFEPALVFAALIVALSAAFGMFRPESEEDLDVALARGLLVAACGFPAAFVVFTLLPECGHARDALALTFLYTVCGITLVRYAGAAFVRTGWFARRVLIVGAGSEAHNVRSELERMGPNRFNLVGFYPVGAAAHTGTLADGRLNTFSTKSSLSDLVDMHRVEEIVVALGDHRGGGLPLEDLLRCRTRGVPVHDLSSFFEGVRGEVPVDSLKASWLIYGDGFVQDRWRTTVKRMFDAVFATLLLIIAFPVMLLAALAIVLESHGPALYTQERVGLHGRVFRLLKFRSMTVDAEKDGVARWAEQFDPRATRIGKLIRRARIDELPQLVNVIRGEMSLVGPRPERPAFVDELRQKIRFYDVRHSVKPGVTGWAQVRYSYGASVEDSVRKLQFDLYYVKNHSLALDFLILVETVRVVLFLQGGR
jgi:sugar transferase (PEP-CTERM system associated)